MSAAKRISRFAEFPYGDYPTTDLVAVGGGSCRYDASLPVRYADRSLMLVNEFWTAYKKEELELCSSDYTDRIAFSEASGIPEKSALRQLRAF